MAPLTQSKPTVAERLAKLKLLLTDLPGHVQVDCPYDVPRTYDFRSFSVDADKAQESELGPVGAFNEAMKGIFGWKTRSHGTGLIHLCPRGPPIISIVDVLQKWTNQHLGDAIIEKWMDDIIAGTEFVYISNDVPVSQFHSYE